MILSVEEKNLLRLYVGGFVELADYEGNLSNRVSEIIHRISVSSDTSEIIMLNAKLKDWSLENNLLFEPPKISVAPANKPDSQPKVDRTVIDIERIFTIAFHLDDKTADELEDIAAFIFSLYSSKKVSLLFIGVIALRLAHFIEKQNRSNTNTWLLLDSIIELYTNLSRTDNAVRWHTDVLRVAKNLKTLPTTDKLVHMLTEYKQAFAEN